MKLWTAMLGAWLVSGSGLASGSGAADADGKSSAERLAGEKLRTQLPISQPLAHAAAEDPAPAPRPPIAPGT
jgi:hypothetical protein